MPNLPDWFVPVAVAIIASLVAPVVKDWFLQRWEKPETEAEIRRTDAETDSEVAEAVVALTAAWDKLLAATQERLEVAERGIDLRDEKIRNLEEEIKDAQDEHALLYEQYSRASVFLAATTAQIALYEGRALVNHEAEPGRNEADSE